MAKEDVFLKIIGVCETSLQQAKTCKTPTDLMQSYGTLVTMIIGICGGATSMGKEEKNKMTKLFFRTILSK